MKDVILQGKETNSNTAASSEDRGDNALVGFSSFTNKYKSRHVAKVIRTGHLLFSGPDNDLTNESHCWFNMDDGSKRDCMFIMDNKQFLRMLKGGEIEFVKTPTPENQTSLFV